MTQTVVALLTYLTGTIDSDSDSDSGSGGGQTPSLRAVTPSSE